jgi:hypothetical protein
MLGWRLRVGRPLPVPALLARPRRSSQVRIFRERWEAAFSRLVQIRCSVLMISYTFSTSLQLQPIEKTKMSSHGFVQRDRWRISTRRNSEDYYSDRLANHFRFDGACQSNPFRNGRYSTEDWIILFAGMDSPWRRRKLESFVEQRRGVARTPWRLESPMSGFVWRSNGKNWRRYPEKRRLFLRLGCLRHLHSTPHEPPKRAVWHCRIVVCLDLSRQLSAGPVEAFPIGSGYGHDDR